MIMPHDTSAEVQQFTCLAPLPPALKAAGLAVEKLIDMVASQNRGPPKRYSEFWETRTYTRLPQRAAPELEKKQMWHREHFAPSLQPRASGLRV